MHSELLSYQRALATFTRIVDEPDNVHGLLQNAAAQVARITHIKHVKILRYRPNLGDLLIEAGVGWRPGVVGHVSLGETGSLPLADRCKPGRRSCRKTSRMIRSFVILTCCGNTVSCQF